MRAPASRRPLSAEPEINPGRETEFCWLPRRCQIRVREAAMSETKLPEWGGLLRALRAASQQDV